VFLNGRVVGLICLEIVSEPFLLTCTSNYWKKTNNEIISQRSGSLLHLFSLLGLRQLGTLDLSGVCKYLFTLFLQLFEIPVVVCPIWVSSLSQLAPLYKIAYSLLLSATLINAPVGQLYCFPSFIAVKSLVSWCSHSVGRPHNAFSRRLLDYILVLGHLIIISLLWIQFYLYPFT